MAALALLHREAVIEQVRAGKRLIDIARGLGLTTHAPISQALSKDPEYQLAREIGTEARLEQREIELEAAADQLTVARARELLSHARWRCEREFPERWGGKQVQINNLNNINVLPDAQSQLEAARRVAFAMAQGAQLSASAHNPDTDDAQVIESTGKLVDTPSASGV